MSNPDQHSLPVCYDPNKDKHRNIHRTDLRARLGGWCDPGKNVFLWPVDHLLAVDHSLAIDQRLKTFKAGDREYLIEIRGLMFGVCGFDSKLVKKMRRDEVIYR